MLNTVLCAEEGIKPILNSFLCAEEGDLHAANHWESQSLVEVEETKERQIRIGFYYLEVIWCVKVLIW